MHSALWLYIKDNKISRLAAAADSATEQANLQAAQAENGEKEKNLKGLETYGKWFLLGISIIKFKDFSFWTKNVKNLVIWLLPVVDCLVLFLPPVCLQLQLAIGSCYCSRQPRLPVGPRCRSRGVYYLWLKPWKRFEPTANFMIFKIRSITASEWLRMIVLRQHTINRILLTFSNNKTTYYTQYRWFSL